MWPLRARRSSAPLGYRLKRLWRRRAVRRAALLYGPALLTLLAGALLVTDPRVHAGVAQYVADAGAALTRRPEFAITEIAIRGASPTVEGEIRAALFDVTGASSLALDASALLRRIEQLGWVARAAVTLEAPNLLRVEVTEREAAAVWRVDGELWLIDRHGARITALFTRDTYPTLPLLAGEGADRAVPEALSLVAAAGPLKPRLRGLVRVGERRWDIVLDRDQTIRLPMATPDRPLDGPLPAMRTALALQQQTEVLDRDVTALDLRLPDRPTVRLHPRAGKARNQPQVTGGRG